MDVSERVRQKSRSFGLVIANDDLSDARVLDRFYGDLGGERASEGQCVPAGTGSRQTNIVGVVSESQLLRHPLRNSARLNDPVLSLVEVLRGVEGARTELDRVLYLQHLR